MDRDVTAEINSFVENHGNELIHKVAHSEISAIVFDSFSDIYKEMHGFRLYCTGMTVKQIVSGLKEMLDTIEAERKKDLVPIKGVFFEGEPLKPLIGNFFLE